MKNDVLNQYEAVHNRVGWRDLSGRGKVRITGPDRVTFLHAMISNEVEGLEDEEGRQGTFLKATGKIIADFYYYRFSGFLLIDVADALRTQLVTELQKYIIMDDVELDDVSQEFEHHSLEGPKASELLRAILNQDAPSDRFEVRTVLWRGENLWWIRKDELTDRGFEIIVPVVCSSEFRDELTAKGTSFRLQEIGPAAYDLLRLEKGIPLFGVDFTSKNNPIEARLKEAYSLTKGCYVGQEVVSKATRVGSVPKALVRLKIVGRAVPAAGSTLVTQDGQEIGRITSAVFSPVLEDSIALALVKKGFWTPGDIYWVTIPSAETQAVEVVESFF